MSERLGIKLRVLPDGPFQDAFETGLEGRRLQLDFGNLDLRLGTLLEIERGSMLFLGELQQKMGSTGIVQIEHSLDRGKLKPIQEMWG